MSETPQRIVVAIDGPAGAGKSTIAKRLAEALGYLHLNSGALYRGATLLALRNGIPTDDGDALAELARNAAMEFTPDGRFLLNGEDATNAIRSPEIDRTVSLISVHKRVREAVTAHQRRIAASASVVIEGRDVTTVVFPDAQVKFYLDASVEERARRRFKELNEKGESVSLDAIKTEIRERDRRDSTRTESPLIAAPDAVRLDSTRLTPDEVIDAMKTAVLKRISP